MLVFFTGSVGCLLVDESLRKVWKGGESRSE